MLTIGKFSLTLTHDLLGKRIQKRCKKGRWINGWWTRLGESRMTECDALRSHELLVNGTYNDLSLLSESGVVP